MKDIQDICIEEYLEEVEVRNSPSAHAWKTNLGEVAASQLRMPRRNTWVRLQQPNCACLE